MGTTCRNLPELPDRLKGFWAELFSAAFQMQMNVIFMILKLVTILLKQKNFLVNLMKKLLKQKLIT